MAGFYGIPGMGRAPQARPGHRPRTISQADREPSSRLGRIAAGGNLSDEVAAFMDQRGHQASSLALWSKAYG